MKSSCIVVHTVYYLQALSEPQHTLQNKVIDPKRAQTRGAIEVCRKIFVGGLDPNLPEESIREYFGRFGKVCSVLFCLTRCNFLVLYLESPASVEILEKL